MLQQNDPQIKHKTLRLFGCYFFTILYFAEKERGEEYTYPDIMTYFLGMVERGFMDFCDAFIFDPEGIFQYFGIDVTYTDRHEPPDYQTLDGDIEILYYERVKPDGDKVPHFVAGDGRGGIAFDPAGDSRTVREGTLKSKRIFRRN